MGYVYERKTIAKTPIASFSDGADQIPTKSLIVTIPPTLSGVSSVTETQTGRNLFFVEDSSLFPRDNNTIVKNVGTYTAWAKVKKNTDYYIKKSGNTNRQNVFGCTSVPAVGVSTYMLTRTEYATNEYRFNSGEYEYIGFYYSNEASEHMMMALSQDDVSIYEVYNATTYTSSLGRTIYGGEVDIVNGEGQDYALWVNLSDIAWTEDTNRAGVFYGSVAGRKTATADDPSDVLDCTCYNVNNVNVTTGIDNYISGARSYGGNIIFFRDSSFHGYTRAQVQEALQGEKVCVVSANPIDYTFTGQEIPTRLGYNAFWSEQGDTEITYYSQIEADGLYTIKDSTIISIADAIRAKKGTTEPIKVKDYPAEIRSISGGGDMNYSTEEHEVGTWIDGSTIYEKTLYAAGGVRGGFNIAHGVENFDKLISYDGFVYDDPQQSQYASGNWIALPRITDDGNNLGVGGCDSINIGITNPSAFQTRLTNWYVSIRYIKSST